MTTTQDDNPEQRTESLLDMLRRLDAEYGEMLAGLDALANESLRAGENLAEVIGVMSQLSEEMRASHRPLVDTLNETLGALCELYLDAPEARREYIRDAFADRKMLRVHLINLTGTACLAIPQEACGGRDAAYWLRIGLAAASIEDNRTDFRDTHVALEYLLAAAVRAGIDPRPCFEHVAARSSAKMREFLSNFILRYPRE